jgi:hypothetical protein
MLPFQDKCFGRLRGHLDGWRATCKRLFPNHIWTGPASVRCGLQRLGNGGGIITDTCTPARCTQRLLCAEIARQVVEKYDSAAWAALSEAEQEAAVRTHAHHCWQHIRNIFLSAMTKAQSAHVKEALQEELASFSSYERMTTDFDQMLRADYKVGAAHTHS